MTGDGQADGHHAPGVLDALREGWHGLGGGDAARCPGCPVCRISESAGRMDPATAEHLQAAAAHLVSAGRELLAALAPGADGRSTRDEPAHPGTEQDGPGQDGRADPVVPPAPARTRIHVETDPTSPARGTEEQA